MPEQSFDVTLRALKKGDVDQVYYLVGAEDLLKADLVREITDRVLDPSLRDFNFDQRTATSLDPEELSTLLNTLPMMSDRRVVVLRDVEGWQKKARGRAELLRYLAKPASETVLLLVQGGVDPDPDTELREARDDGSLCATAAGAGAALAGAPVGAARHYAGAGRGGALAARRGQRPHHSRCRDGKARLARRRVRRSRASWWAIWWACATARRCSTGATPCSTTRPGRALTLLRPVLDQSGISGVKLVSLLGTTLAGVVLARAHRDKGTRAGALEGAILQSLYASRPFGLPEWKAEAARWARWSERWPASRLSAAIRVTLTTDQALKSTTLSDEQALLGELVMRLGVSRAERVA